MSAYEKNDDVNDDDDIDDDGVRRYIEEHNATLHNSCAAYSLFDVRVCVCACADTSLVLLVY